MNSLVGKVASRGEAKFEECWVASGFDGGRNCRDTARIAAAMAALKFEPDETTSEKKAQMQSDGIKGNGKQVRPPMSC
jgi:hypothetical protein